MPYIIKPTATGYKVFSGKKSFSKGGLTKNQARKQRIAIVLSESKRTGKPVSELFG
jgi:hypothetical protein